MLTCMHIQMYNACIMIQPTQQITIRGIDPATKEALVKKAKQSGVSLNRYVVTTLRRNSGMQSSVERSREMKEFISMYPVSKKEILAIKDSLAWSKHTSIGKQQLTDTKQRLDEKQQLAQRETGL